MGQKAPLELITTDLTGLPAGHWKTSARETGKERSWSVNIRAQEEQAATQPVLQNQVASLYQGPTETILTHHCFSCA